MALGTGDILVYNGTNWVNNGYSQVMLSDAPAASANYGLLSLGSGPWDGSSAGHFVGSANGTALAINTVSTFAGNLTDFQVAGVARFQVSNLGRATCFYVDANGAQNAYALQVNHQTTATAASGFGVGIQFMGQDGGGGQPEIGTIQVYEADVTAGHVYSAMSFSFTRNGVGTQILLMDSSAGASPGRVICKGEFSHTGPNLGFFSVGPVARAAAYTLTYSTTTRTNPVFTGQDNTQGGSVYAKFGDLQTLQQLVNAVITDLKGYGLLQ